MFRRLEGHGQPMVTLLIEDRPVTVPAGTSVAAAMLTAGFSHSRTTPVEGSERGPFCLMGVCFDCLAEIDGQPNVQACRTEVREGMVVRRQLGVRRVGP